MIFHRDEFAIFNGDLIDWDPAQTYEYESVTYPGAHWPDTVGGFTGARNWNGGPGVGGDVYVGPFPLTPAQTMALGSTMALFYSVVTPATEGGDHTSTGWMTVVESDTEGPGHDVTTPWGVARWAGQTVRLSAWFSTNQEISVRLVAWQSYGSGEGVTPFAGVIAGSEMLIQAVGWVEIDAELEIPSVAEGTVGSNPYVGVGLDIRAGYAGTFGITNFRVAPV